MSVDDSWSRKALWKRTIANLVAEMGGRGGAAADKARRPMLDLEPGKSLRQPPDGFLVAAPRGLGTLLGLQGGTLSVLISLGIVGSCADMGLRGPGHRGDGTPSAA